MKLRSLEVLRGLAALSVVFAHASTLIVLHQGLGIPSFHHGLEFYGLPGVEFFFVLSGFVMAMMHGGDIGRLARVPTFLWSRFCRIYPLLWVVLAFRCWQDWDIPVVTPGHILSWMTLSPFYDLDIIPVVWTLKLELGFYLLFAAALLPWVGPLVLLCWVGFVVMWLCGFPGGPYISPEILGNTLVFRFLLFSPTFLIGAFAGGLFRLAKLPVAASAALLLGGVALATWRLSQDSWGLTSGPILAQLAYGPAIAAIILGLTSLERGGHLRVGRWALALGAMSYPMYIAHIPTIDAVAKALITVGRPHWMGRNAVFTAFVLACAAVSLLLAYAVDRPLNRALRSMRPGSVRSSRQAPGDGRAALVRQAS